MQGQQDFNKTGHSNGWSIESQYSIPASSAQYLDPIFQQHGYAQQQQQSLYAVQASQSGSIAAFDHCVDGPWSDASVSIESYFSQDIPNNSGYMSSAQLTGQNHTSIGQLSPQKDEKNVDAHAPSMNGALDFRPSMRGQITNTFLSPRKLDDLPSLGGSPAAPRRWRRRRRRRRRRGRRRAAGGV